MSYKDFPKFFDGSGLAVTRSALGNMLSWRPTTNWKHPWFTTGRYSPVTSAWTAYVTPGMVNGLPPNAALTVATAPNLTLERARANKVDLSVGTAAINAPLTDNPGLPLSFRNIGVDDQTGNAIPAFFEALGVHPGVPYNPDDERNTKVASAPPGNRLLRACDIVVQQPRYALTATTSIGAAAGSNASIIQTLVAEAPASGQVLLIYATDLWTPTVPALDPTTGTYAEPTYDEIQVSTIYLLSAPDAVAGSEPDGSWTQYAQHYCFWNLGWAQDTTLLNIPASNVGFVIALPSGFIAQPLVDTILTEINDAYNEAATILEEHSLAGYFWSMGGCSPITAPTSALGNQVQTFGLNKNAANAVAAALARKAPTPLDPVFPYAVQPFPHQLFSLGSS